MGCSLRSVLIPLAVSLVSSGAGPLSFLALIFSACIHVAIRHSPRPRLADWSPFPLCSATLPCGPRRDIGVHSARMVCRSTVC